MRHARQDQKQGQVGEPGVADGGGQSELIGDLLQDEEQAEDGAEDGFAGRELIEVAAEHLTQGLDAGGSPGGEVGESAGFDFAVVPERLAEEDGWRRVPIGDEGDVHAHHITYYKYPVNRNIPYTSL